MSHRLSELDARLMRHDGDRTLYPVSSVAEASCVVFLCPKCFVANKGEVGTHSVLCYFRDRGVPPDARPGPARWEASGAGIEDLTLAPSVLLIGGCAWHGFVRNGEAVE